MTTKETRTEAAKTEEAPEPPKQPLTPEAERALAEAEERRRKRDAEAREPAVEKGGQSGPDPVRYGDWEKGGIISDF
ncbi:MAG: DUF1674 domain-containing protein [Hyphomicrobiaceae bacterium]